MNEFTLFFNHALCGLYADITRFSSGYGPVIRCAAVVRSGIRPAPVDRSGIRFCAVHGSGIGSGTASAAVVRDVILCVIGKLVFIVPGYKICSCFAPAAAVLFRVREVTRFVIRSREVPCLVF